MVAERTSERAFFGAAASFLGMWVVMMVAMMRPSLVQMLWHYREAVGRTGKTRLAQLTALVGVGSFCVWTVFGMAWRHGLRLGLHCRHCCAGLMALLLVIGVMDRRAMAIVTAAITVECLAPAGERVARATGAVIVGAGLVLIARAAGLG